MNPRPNLLILLCLAAVFAAPASAQADRGEAERLFQTGNVYYGEGRFEEAREAYEQALAFGHSAALHFNLGNTYFQEGDAGRAILHYMRAQALRPGDPDIAANLRFVREAAGVDPPPAQPLSAFAASLPRAVWTALALGGIWTAAFAFLVFPRLARAGLLSRLTGGLALAAALTALVALAADRAHSGLGVVLAPEANLRVAPTSGSPSEATARAGESAALRESRERFHNVRFPDGRSGFLSREEFEPVHTR
ncbi:MAG: tetratricopeptide repeat protein [Opitutales bacterium]|nr:tetratricopeptide repeat protein [Opitutales bacterium]